MPFNVRGSFFRFTPQRTFQGWGESGTRLDPGRCPGLSHFAPFGLRHDISCDVSLFWGIKNREPCS